VKQRPREQWTEAQLEAERQYRITERLGLLIGTGKPTLSAEAIANREATEAVEKLKNES
jgi:hypothetical protein